MKRFTVWIKEMGRSAAVGRKWAKLGWVEPCRIGGVLYITAKEERRFEERAGSGEFDQGQRGNPNWKKEELTAHIPNCELGDGWKECPACAENHNQTKEE